MMHTPKFWAAATVFWAGVAMLGLVGVFLEAEGRSWRLGAWYGGVVLAAVSARQWEVRRKRRLTPPSV
jgi:hypothetical protein